MGRFGRKLRYALQDFVRTYQLYEGTKTRWERIRLAIYLSPLSDPFHNVLSFFRIQQERITRLYTYGKYLWRIGEFDYAWHLGLWELSLTRLHKILEQGTSVTTSKKMRKIKIAIECLRRMKDTGDCYLLPALDAFDRKWGIEGSSTETVNQGNGRWIFKKDIVRENLTGLQKEHFDKEYKTALTIEDTMFKRDVEMFYKILSKNMQSWWD